MRVLLVSDFFPPVTGGLEHHVDALAGNLVARGHQVAVATTTADAVSSHRDVVIERIAPASSRLIRHADENRRFPVPLPDPAARAQLRAVITRFGPDVVHAHGWLAASLPSRRPPLIWTAHDYGLVCARRTLLNQRDRICSGPAPGKCWRCARHQYGAARAALLGPATAVGRSLVKPDLILAVSPAVAEAIRPRFAAPIDVVENFVEPAPPRSQPPEWLPRPPFVMFAGEPSHHKGIDVLLDCWRHDPPAASLVIAATRRLSGTLPPHVVVGHLERNEMSEAWRSATVGVIPSRWPDPCPTVALEAMRAGTPVVASDVGGLPHLVRDGVDGVLVPPGDAVRLRAAITELLADVPRRRAMAVKARERAAEFSADSVVPRIEAAYERVVRDRQPR